MPVPHVGHLPFIAGFPFFIVTFTALGSSLFARHFTQYMLAIILFTPSLYMMYESATSPPIANAARISVFKRSLRIA